MNEEKNCFLISDGVKLCEWDCDRLTKQFNEEEVPGEEVPVKYNNIRIDLVVFKITSPPMCLMVPIDIFKDSVNFASSYIKQIYISLKNIGFKLDSLKFIHNEGRGILGDKGWYELKVKLDGTKISPSGSENNKQ